MRLGLREAAALAGAILVAFGAGCGTGVGVTASMERDCGRAVIADWTDGAIDRPYADTCYLAAIDALPEDMRAYTSAVADIQRAMMSTRGKAASRLLAESFATEEPESKPDEVPWVVAGLGAFAAALAAAGGTAFVVRRRRTSA